MGTALRIIALFAALAWLPISSAGAAPATTDSIPQEDTRVFESDIDPGGAVGDDMPLTSDDIDPDGVFGMSIEPDGMGDAGGS